MFDSLRESMRRSKEAREKAKTERAKQERDRLYEAERQRQAERERVRRIKSIRVITGEVKYRYAIVDTVRAVGFYEAEHGNPVMPDEATNRAIAQMQEKAFRVGADAIIHAQFHVVRYTVQRRQFLFTPVYEVHAFGTAIKVVGPPSDWNTEADA